MAYSKGVRYFDTAPSYGKGEDFLRDWNAKHQHQDVVLSTKWGYTYVANWELNFDGKHEIKNHSLDTLTHQWAASKVLLPSLKMYQVHSATFESGILENEEVLKELSDLKKKHQLTIGITTSGVNQKEVIAKALDICISGDDLFDSFQVTYNVLESSIFSIVERLKEKNKVIIIKEALANGRVFDAKYSEGTMKLLAKKYNVGIDAIAIRYVIDSIQPAYVLSGAFSKRQLEENLKALNFVLIDEEIELLNKLNIDSETYWEERSQLEWN